VDVLYAPLSAAEVTLAVTLAAVSRSVMIAFISIIFFYFIIGIEIQSFLLLILYILLSSFSLGALGVIAGLWAEKFDHMASVTNFIIVPLSFLSGTFYSIERLPDYLQVISKINPFFYMIDGFRFCFIDKSDGSIIIGLIYLIFLSLSIWFIAYILYKKGYKIKF
jgi:ABC-2 type transport system permease protein